MLQDQTRRYISTLSDSALIEYLAEDIYEPAAIEFARQVAASRQIDPQRLAELQSQARASLEARSAATAEAAARPLGTLGKVVAFFAGIQMLGLGGLGLLVVPFHLKDSGQLLKRREMWRCAWYGFATLWGLVLLLLVFGYLLPGR